MSNNVEVIRNGVLTKIWDDFENGAGPVGEGSWFLHTIMVIAEHEPTSLNAVEMATLMLIGKIPKNCFECSGDGVTWKRCGNHNDVFVNYVYRLLPKPIKMTKQENLLYDFGCKFFSDKLGAIEGLDPEGLPEELRAKIAEAQRQFQKLYDACEPVEAYLHDHYKEEWEDGDEEGEPALTDGLYCGIDEVQNCPHMSARQPPNCGRCIKYGEDLSCADVNQDYSKDRRLRCTKCNLMEV